MPPNPKEDESKSGPADNGSFKAPEITLPKDEQLARHMALFGTGPLKDNPRGDWFAMAKEEATPFVKDTVRSIMSNANCPPSKFEEAFDAQVDNLLSNDCHHVIDWSWAALDDARSEIMQVIFLQEHYGVAAMVSWLSMGFIAWVSFSQGMTGGDDAIKQAVERYHLLDKMPTAIAAFEKNGKSRSGVFIIDNCPLSITGPLSIKPAPSDEPLVRVDKLTRVKFTVEPSLDLELGFIFSNISLQDNVSPVLPPPSFIDVEEERVWHRAIVMAKHMCTFDELVMEQHFCSELVDQVKALEGGEIAVLPSHLKDALYLFGERFHLPEVVKMVNEATDDKTTHTATVTVKQPNPNAWSATSPRRLAGYLGTLASMDENSDVGKTVAKTSRMMYEFALLAERKGLGDIGGGIPGLENQMEELEKMFKDFSGQQ